MSLETGGAFLWLLGAEIMEGRLEPFGGLLVLCGILVLWVLPNAAILHKARGLFAVKEKAGLSVNVSR